ncbi:TIGR03854 family LLM class F420-dependent oxidoreductase [Nocardia macrotermitis]|uniref:F420-dependent glucose-6-phosphate dehydrogenase n=1 Tax=Nocardia macrotermitis TaxID=2585198 RepID=A0A7K0D2V8_9NOCA|nr:TIGR03854 family LLM class F420-dependent oxidoreductase [Nocardia macrotermitis]MQY20063.1 F420-dependent glucose-6-phosphate dehydrogenase [Nocardia macrotermitis]
MKVRFGVAAGIGSDPGRFPGFVDRLEEAGVDSLWLPELVYSKAVDPTVGMAFALSRTTRLKVGTSVAILPGRHPVLVAKQLATLAALAPKRVLPVFGLRPAQPAEHDLFPVPPGKRAAVFDESLRLLREVLDSERVDFAGEFFTLDGEGLEARPTRPLDIWLGGSAPAGLRRVGRLADGWLGSFLTPAEAGRARETIRDAADQAGREIEDDHYGITVFLAEDGIAPERAAQIRSRRPDIDPSELIANGWPGLHRLIDGYIAAGLSKFVISTTGDRPYEEFIDRFAAELLPRQN